MEPKTMTAMITRNCPWHCPHCTIWKSESEDLPPSYWIELGSLLDEKWKIHLNMFGGEPLFYRNNFDDLVQLVKGYTDRGFSYSINSSSIGLDRQAGFNKMQRLADAGLRNWTASIDSLTDPRCKLGYETLTKFGKMGVQDLVVEAVIYPGKQDAFIEAMKACMDSGFWISVSFYAWSKAKQYDSFPPKPAVWTESDLQKNAQIRDLMKDYDRLHGGTKEYLDKWTDMEYLMMRVKDCQREIQSFTPNFDGKMRLCRDIKGNRVTGYDAHQAVLNWDEFSRAWEKDYDELCQGCTWACVTWARNLKEEIKHR